MTIWQTVANAADIPPERATVFEVGDHEVAICNVDGDFYAIDDVCTHDGGALDQGELEGNEIECPRHGARFDVRTGEATQLPAYVPVATHAVRVDGGTIQVAMEHD
jgi:3-phenylpropionate/trans-cinnamate dioxygenase ferredoxin subunit